MDIIKRVVETEHGIQTLNCKKLAMDIDTPIKIAKLDFLQPLSFKRRVAVQKLFANLSACVDKKQMLVYSRNNNGGIKSRIRIGVSAIIKAIDWMVEQGWVHNTIGVSSIDPKYRVLSTLEPTKKFIEWNSKLVINKECIESYHEKVEKTVMRDKHKKQLKLVYPLPISIREREETLSRLNYLLDINDIKYEGNYLSNVYAQIYNNSNYEDGGRWYRADILQLPSLERLKVTINGSPITEVDYSCVHYFIASCMAGMDYDQLPSDIYARIIGEYPSPNDRDFIKVALNIMFNTDNKESARAAIQLAFKRFEPDTISFKNANRVMTEIYRELDSIKEFLCNNCFGLKLQNADSHLMHDIVKEFVKDDTPILPVHDSFIVPEEHKGRLIQTMANKFVTRFLDKRRSARIHMKSTQLIEDEIIKETLEVEGFNEDYND